MTLAAGKLRHLVEIQEKVQTRVSGSSALQWLWTKITDGDWWVAIEPLSTREFMAAGAMQGKATARIIGRYRPDVTSAMRIKHNDAIYSIEGPPLADKESGLEYITLLVSQGTNKGA